MLWFPRFPISFYLQLHRHRRLRFSKDKTMDLQARITALEYELQVLSKDVAKDGQARQRFQVVTCQATAAVETPPETIWKLLFQVMSLSKAETWMIARC